MKKIMISSAMALLALSAVHAQNAVVIHQTNGQTTNCFFTEKPRVTYLGDCLVMSTQDQNVQYSLRSLRKIEFAQVEIPTDIDSPTTAQEKAMLLGFRAGQVTVNNARPGVGVMLYDMDGKTLFGIQTDDSGHANISTSSLPKGTYILQVGEESYKIIR